MPSSQPLAAQSFEIVEATIDDIHAAYRASILTARQLVQMYLDRIAAYDKKGSAINAIISLNPTALEEADRLDAAFGKSGFVGPLHGILVIMKNQTSRACRPRSARHCSEITCPSATASSSPS
jgi:Asp-tRNA(Asn)/Glu-tRNA(Gln) amidotransferase A subunit family amidase